MSSVGFMHGVDQLMCLLSVASSIFQMSGWTAEWLDGCEDG